MGASQVLPEEICICIMSGLLQLPQLYWSAWLNCWSRNYWQLAAEPWHESPSVFVLSTRPRWPTYSAEEEHEMPPCFGPFCSPDRSWCSFEQLLLPCCVTVYNVSGRSHVMSHSRILSQPLYFQPKQRNIFDISHEHTLLSRRQDLVVHTVK